MAEIFDSALRLEKRSIAFARAFSITKMFVISTRSDFLLCSSPLGTEFDVQIDKDLSGDAEYYMILSLFHLRPNHLLFQLLSSQEILRPCQVLLVHERLASSSTFASIMLTNKTSKQVHAIHSLAQCPALQRALLSVMRFLGDDISLRSNSSTGSWHDVSDVRLSSMFSKLFVPLMVFTQT